MIPSVAQWLIFETCLPAQGSAGSPALDISVDVQFTSPSGVMRRVEAFWDGGQTWRVRFSPDEIGRWTWQSRYAASETGLSGLRGAFDCTPYAGDNPLYRHGALRTSPGRRRLVHADGTPFFWLADTAWNGVLCARDADWSRYLAARREQAFSAIQFVSTQWRAFEHDAAGRTAFTRTPSFAIDPAFYQALDAKVAAINAQGLLAAPVMIWSCTANDPGRILTEQEMILLARYLQARWGAYQVAWILGGDGNYETAWKQWLRVGRAVFADRHDRLVTMHMGGQQWTAERFRGEPWFDFIGYQSGHGASARELAWLVQGPPVVNQDRQPLLPIINMEPNYEGHPAYVTGQLFSPYEVRRASYWSMLLTPPAGITYGNNPIWCWMEKKAPSPGHNLGMVEPWQAGVETPGIAGMTILRRFFESQPWERLRPAQTVLAEQPGSTDPARFVAAASSAQDGVTLLYLPVGGTVRLRAEALVGARTACWFNPRTGQYTAPTPLPADALFTAPDANDWLLTLRSK